MDKNIFVGEHQTSREALAIRSERLASGMASLGLKQGDIVAVLMRNRMAYLEIILACRRLGVYYCPINWHFTASEVRYILEDSAARLLLTEAELVNTAAEANSTKIPTVCLDAPSNAGPTTDLVASCNDYDSWIESLPRYTGPAVSPRGHMAYTSGTTGKPKGVIRNPVPVDQLADHQTVLLEIVKQTLGLQQGSRALMTAPIYHSAPSLFCQMALQLCDHFIVMERFDAEAFLQLIDKHQIDVVYLVPIMYMRLLKLPESVRSKYDLSSLRFVASTGAPCPPEIKAQMIEWLGPILYETYASSEVGMVTLADSAQALSKPGTAGKPVGPADIRIVDEHGAELPANTTGRIYVRQPAYPDFTYKNNPAARQAIEHDGYLSLGDIGYLDDDGFLFVCDRESDMVLSGGVNIYPAEIEQVLMLHPDIADCAVIGLPDPEYGERLRAFIDLEPGKHLDEQHLQQWLSQYLARFKVPREFIFDHPLPRDPNGKILRRKLKAQFLDQTSHHTGTIKKETS